MSIREWITQLGKRNLKTMPEFGLPLDPEPAPFEETPQTPQPGLVWVDGNGHINVRNPDPEEPYAVIYLDPQRRDLELLVNGKPRYGSIVVQETDHIVARPDSPPSKSRVTVDVDGTGMVATLTATFELGMVRQLQECGPVHVLEIATHEFFRAPVPILMQHVLDELDHKQIRYGRVASPVIQEFLQQRQTGSIPVAYGTEAATAVPDTYIPTTRRGSEYYPGTGISHPDLVAAGTVVATRVTGNPSRVGMTVYGTPIPPLPGNLSSLHIGSGISPMNLGQHLVAKAPGRVIWGDKEVRLIPLKIFNHDLTGDNEMVYEPGDVIIGGALAHNVLIAGGNVIITGDVSHSRIMAAGSIFVEGTLDYATLECGVEQPFSLELRRKIAEIGEALGTLTQLMEQIREEAPDAYQTQFSSILEKLFRQKCSFVPATVLWLSQAPRFDDPLSRSPSPVTALIEKILQCFEPESWQALQDVSGIQNLSTHIEQWLASESTPKNLAGIFEAAVLKNVYRSLVRSQGAIDVHDAVTSDMEAGTEIQARTLVGGFYQAQQAISAQFIGSEDRVETSVQVFQASGKVSAEILFPNTVVQIGEQRHRVNRVAKNAVVDSF